MPDEWDPDAVYQRVLRPYNSIPPGPDRTERFLEKLHGVGWKQRAMAVGPLTLELGRQLRELEARVSRIERHLSQSSKLLEWPNTTPIAPLPPRAQDE